MVVLHRGRGTLRLGETTRRLSRGSLIVIPRGTPHAYVNASSRRPAVLIVVFSPPYNGTDSVPIGDTP